MPDVGPCELVAGRIVPVSPGGVQHSVVTANVFRLLDTFVRERRLGPVLTGAVGVYTRHAPDTVRGADVVYISAERYARRTSTLPYLDVAPELIVEVLSGPATIASLTDKLAEYVAAGVRLVWVVETRARRARVYRSLADVRELAEHDVLSGEDVLAGFRTDVRNLFEEEGAPD